MRRTPVILLLCALALAVSCFRRNETQPPAAGGNAKGAKPPSAEELSAGNWQTGPLACGPKDCAFKVKLVAERVCHLGDLDVIAEDLSKYSGEKTALLSLEPLDVRQARSFPPISHQVPLDTLLTGATFDFTFPRPGPTQLGIFLCKDSARSSHCLDKRFMDGTKLVVQSAFNAEKKPEFHSPDTVYFFQYLYIDGAIALAFKDMSPKGLSDDIFENRLKFVLARADSAAGEFVKHGMQTARRASLAARSMPLELDAGQIRIPLPKRSSDCGSSPGH